MKKKVLLGILFLGIAILIWFFAKDNKMFSSQENKSFSGTIEATLIPVQSELTGKITEITVKEGQNVKTGAIIAKLDDQSMKIALAKAQSQLKQTEERLQDLLDGTRAQEIRRYQANVEQSQAGLEQAVSAEQQLESIVARDLENLKFEEQSLKEADALYKEATISKKEYDTQVHKLKLAEQQYQTSIEQYEGTKAQYKSSLAQLNSTKATLDLALSGYTQPTILAQKAAVEGAQQAVNLAKLNLTKAVIKSSVDGNVLYKHVELGEVVNPTGRILTLLDPHDIWVRIYVPEAELNTIEIGKKANISVDAFPGKTFAGEITNISDKAEFTPKNVQTKEERTTIVFAVKVQIKEGFGKLKSGMPADVVIK